MAAFFFMTTPEDTTPAGIEAETRQGLALVDAAGSAAVPHVVFSSVGGAERDSGVPHFESKRRVEEHLLKSGLRATVVRPVAFMENYAFMGRASRTANSCCAGRCRTTSRCS